MQAARILVLLVVFLGSCTDSPDAGSEGASTADTPPPHRLADAALLVVVQQAEAQPELDDAGHLGAAAKQQGLGVDGDGPEQGPALRVAELGLREGGQERGAGVGWFVGAGEAAEEVGEHAVHGAEALAGDAGDEAAGRQGRASEAGGVGAEGLDERRRERLWSELGESSGEALCGR